MTTAETFATRQARAAHVDRRLAELFPATPIPLDHRDAYTLLIAVLLSAQCTDRRVNLVTPGLFARAATPAAMAELPVAEIERLIRTCGLAPAEGQGDLRAFPAARARPRRGRCPAASTSWRLCPASGTRPPAS